MLIFYQLNIFCTHPYYKHNTLCILYSIQSCSMTKIVKLGPELQTNKLSGIPKLTAFKDSHTVACVKK